MSSSKSLFEDVKWALSHRKLGSFKTPLKKALKMHKYAKRFSIKKKRMCLPNILLAWHILCPVILNNNTYKKTELYLNTLS